MVFKDIDKAAQDGLFGGTALVRREPIGVVAAIVPWNVPQTVLSFKLAPALAAGCCIVIKPPPEIVLDAFLLAEILDQVGLPPGVVSIRPGGPDLGAYLISHPGVDMVAFTGSSAAGHSIAEACGRPLRPVILELGGRSAAIVLDDADLTANLESLFAATMIGNGEVCSLSTRVLALRNHYRQVVDTLHRPGRLGHNRRSARRQNHDRTLGHGRASGTGRTLHRPRQSHRRPADHRRRDPPEMDRGW